MGTNRKSSRLRSKGGTSSPATTRRNPARHASATAHSKATASSRKRSLRGGDDASSDSSASSDEAVLSSTKERKRPRRSFRLGLAAEDETSDDVLVSGTPPSDDNVLCPPSCPIAPPPTPKAGQGRKSGRSRNPRGATPRSKTKAKTKTRPPRGQDETTSAQPAVNEPDAVIPNWLDARIDYYIWLRVFEYAADIPGEDTTQWLLRAARTCHTFAEPALTVLYRCPPLTTDNRLHKLTSLLANSSAGATLFNYRAKIRSIHLDITKVQVREAYGVPINLIQDLPRLSEIRLVHPFDDAPYRKLDENIRFEYPESLFRGLGVSSSNALVGGGNKVHPTRLTSWEWNGRMIRTGFIDGLDKMCDMHLTVSFQTIRRLHFVNFQMPSWERNKQAPDEEDEEAIDEDRQHVDQFAGCLKALPDLEELIIESSSVVCADLLPLLPVSLRRVEFTNCWWLESQDFAPFLLSHGRHLETLTLNHNHSLNLTFLPILSAACPDLKEFRMNLRYFREHNCFGDAAPNYEELLLPDQVPRWPPSLQVIDMDSIRGWTPNVAAMFFQSFIDGAQQLPMLRHMSFKCMLNIPWRMRSEFRRHWQEKLEVVFLRPFIPPSSLSHSARAIEKPLVKPKTKKSRPQPSRQSGRIASQKTESPSRVGSAGKNLRSLHKTAYQEPDTDEFDELEEDDDAEDSNDDNNNTGGDDDVMDKDETNEVPQQTFVQGLCTVVNLDLDNQRPREQQWQMEDFLDSANDDSDSEWDAGYDS